MICPEKLDLINTISNVVVAVSASVALFTYFYNRRKDNVLAVVDQVSFFREKVLAEVDKYIKFVRAKDPDYIFSRISLDSPDIKVIREKHKIEVAEQIDLIKTYGDELFSLQVSSLNLAEELSLRIIYSKTINHKAFNSIKPVFVQLVEMSALILMQERDVITGNEVYSAILELYNKWKDNVDRSSPEERTQKILDSYEKK